MIHETECYKSSNDTRNRRIGKDKPKRGNIENSANSWNKYAFGNRIKQIGKNQCTKNERW